MDELLFALFGRYLNKSVVLRDDEGNTKLGILTDIEFVSRGHGDTQFSFILDGQPVEDGRYYIEGAAK